MGVLVWFAPWAVYWVLVGHVPPSIAAALALAMALAVVAGDHGRPARLVGGGAVATFTVLAALPLAGDAAAPRWLLPVSFAGLLAVLLAGRATGGPVVEDVVRADLPEAVVESELFAPVVNRLTQIWLGSVAAMLVSASIPAIALPADAGRDTGSVPVYLCCWVIPFGILAAATLASRLSIDRMTAGFGDAVRKTSFVAFVDLEIDQLYYLATEHANREVGPGQEAYNITVGTKGTALVGDETRVSWPSTYKVRQRRS
ncbi:hypothetical protein MU0083_000161 [[Mycobacterium] kokjensenii]|uniref:Uncharacterized protein n=1 Tax=[Mycobacterium] kokjensenii TaxID=3064287 RepID=A0ABN9MR43_9MYCO|nr:hypothetical protein [Mycolicibacter sp. MU0083]CAJ1493127.1 hypothetical protein MU0083_000161 [Mycolicibacter sp. MU0083]